ncbi:hypothetical protein [Nocardia amikacinitolerans]|uniref:hypothetical protein n=1 Tax=Nocardia amikacinitolerans TaxID=756689 RepID=UPI0020A2D564|nr:hypothetical protein [Nocardia amikacinitolerans]
MIRRPGSDITFNNFHRCNSRRETSCTPIGLRRSRRREGTEIMRLATRKFGRKALIAALPLAVAVTFAGAGAASADASSIAPQSAGVVQAVEASDTVQQVIPVIARPAAADIAQPATPEVAQPVAAVVPQDIATNPNAANHDPLANGAAAGAIVGAVFGAVVCGATIVGIPLIPLCALGPAFQGAVIGLIVGAIAPDVIPQVLP